MEDGQQSASIGEFLTAEKAPGQWIDYELFEISFVTLAAISH